MNVLIIIIIIFGFFASLAREGRVDFRAPDFQYFNPNFRTCPDILDT